MAALYRVTNPLPHNEKYRNKLGYSDDVNQLIRLITFSDKNCDFFKDTELVIELELKLEDLC